MALPYVEVVYRNGQLGQIIRSDDRVVGLVINGVPSGAPLQLFSASDAASHPTTANAQYSAEYNRQIKEFYKAAGDGTELWVQPVDPAIATDVLFGPGGVVETMLTLAGGRINVVGLSRFKAGVDTPTILTGLDADTLNAMDEAQALGDSMAARNTPVRFILDGRQFQGDPAVLPDLKTQSYNRIAICVASSLVGIKTSCMGLLLGRIASIPVNRNIGRVKDGSAPTSSALLTNGQTIESFGNRATALHDKGYIFLRKFPNKGGYYWNDDHMVCSDTNDYSSLSNGRTIDKAARLAYSTFVEELLDNVMVDQDTGKIVPTTVKMYQTKIERAITLGMLANEEISGVRAFVNPDQDILATSKLYVDLFITPTGTNRAITVKLGFYNPNAA